MPATWIIRISCFSHPMFTVMRKDKGSAFKVKRLSVFAAGILLFGQSMASAADDTCTMNYDVELGLSSDCVFDRALPPLFVPGTRQTSYELQASVLNTDIHEIRRLNGQTSETGAAYAYGDFDGDGDEDIFVAPGKFFTEESTPVEIYFNDGDGSFRLDNSFFQGTVPELVHPRKAITGDFNGDGRLDIFVAGHGYDKPPFPGEAPVLLLSTENGLRQAEGLDHLVGFHHGAAAADIDNDGDLDIFVTDNIADGPFFLINDGNGVFSHNVDVLPSEVTHQAIFTAELVDVDNDGYTDLLVGGHEAEPEDEGSPTTIFWGDASGQYDGSRKTALPGVDGRGIVVDIDVGDLDGDGIRDIVLNRTAEEPFYSGFYIQVISGTGNRAFSDTTDQSIDFGAKDVSAWIVWLRLADINGDGQLDITVDDPGDDAGSEFTWLNDGSGRMELVKHVYRPYLHDWMQITDGLNDTQIRELMDALVRSSDTVIHMDSDSSPVATASDNVELDVLQSATGVTFRQIHGHSDVPLAIGFRDTGSESYLEYGGWLEHSMFYLTVSDADSGFHADAYSLGAATGTNPVSGSGTWIGSVIGVDTHVIGRGRAIGGKAEINVDFADADVDVAFTFMTYHLEGNINHPDITWDNLPLDAGEFGSDTIHGVFYGPNHEEVGGVFRRDGLLGAFGGSRE